MGNFISSINSRFTVHNLGRGVWNYHNYWVWGYGFSQINEQSLLSFTLGNVNGDPEATQATEDAFFINGVIHKLSTVRFERLDNVWIFKTESKVKELGQCNLKFTFENEEIDNVNYLLIMKEQSQFFGYWSGTFVSETGVVHQIDKAKGVVEEMKSRG